MPPPFDTGLATIITLPQPLRRRVLAMGSEAKNRIALGVGSTITLSPPSGELSDPEARQRLEEAVAHLRDDPATAPEVIAVDLHPDLFPSILGRRLAASWEIPVVAVQHHHAHGAAGLAEHALAAGLAVVFDGLGWGPDGRLWGAELLRIGPDGFSRLGTFAPVPLPGGDAAVREPRRQLVGRWVAAGIEPPPAWRESCGVSEPEAGIWAHQCRRGVLAPVSHAAGRLFDAFAAWLGVAPTTIAHEGEAAMRLEAEARRWTDNDCQRTVSFARREAEGLLEIDWSAAFRLPPPARKMPRGEAPAREAASARAEWAMAFHRAMAQAIGEMAAWGIARTGLTTVILSGGVFFNTVLCELVIPELASRGGSPLFHRQVATGDAGIALGQAWIAGGNP
ncbi:MAG: hypothetical protein HQL59_01400 [Magnetococcales bacterium]|nr:hypothetical protein [Magnetococcales bacterium]